MSKEGKQFGSMGKCGSGGTGRAREQTGRPCLALVGSTAAHKYTPHHLGERVRTEGPCMSCGHDLQKHSTAAGVQDAPPYQS